MRVLDMIGPGRTALVALTGVAALLIQGCSANSGSSADASAVSQSATGGSSASAGTGVSGTAPASTEGSAPPATTAGVVRSPSITSSNLSSPAATLAIDTTSYRLVSSHRVGRTTFTYSYTVNVINSGGLAAAGVSATVSSGSAATQIISGTVSFGAVGPTSTVTSTGTFTIEQDRTVPFNPATLTWTIGSDGGLNAFLQGLVANGVLPSLDTSSSLTGSDINRNGVRDDIDALIAGLPDTPVQQAALTQEAQNLQATLTVDISNASALNSLGTAIDRGVACVYLQYPTATAGDRLKWLQMMTMNTPTRIHAYITFNQAMNGYVSPAATVGVCGA